MCMCRISRTALNTMCIRNNKSPRLQRPVSVSVVDMCIRVGPLCAAGDYDAGKRIIPGELHFRIGGLKVVVGEELVVEDDEAVLWGHLGVFGGADLEGFLVFVGIGWKWRGLDFRGDVYDTRLHVLVIIG